MEGKQVPQITFNTGYHLNGVCGPDSFVWEHPTSADLFDGKRVVLFALPGAFTPTCSSTHLPGYESRYDELTSLGVDEVVCLSVNDAFVMWAWGADQNISRVRMLSDGNGEFTKEMGMLVEKCNLGFGTRSWRYSMVVQDGVIEKMFVEPGHENNCASDPFEVSDVDTMINYLKEQS